MPIGTCPLCHEALTAMHVCAAAMADPRCKRMHVDGVRCSEAAGHGGFHVFEHGQSIGVQIDPKPLTFGMGIVGPVKVDAVTLNAIQDQAQTRIAELEARIAKLESTLQWTAAERCGLAYACEHAFKVLAQLPTRDMSTEQQRAVRDAVHRIGPAVARALGRKWK